MNTKFLVAFTFMCLLVGFVANSVGLTAPMITPAEGEFSGIWNALMAVVNSMGAIVQLMTFSVEGMPAIIHLLFVMPFTFGILYIILSLIRGSS